MKSKLTRSNIARWSLFGLRAGMGLAIVNFLIFFGNPAIREPVYGLLSRFMEPLLLGVPAGVGALSLLVWMVCLLWKDDSGART